MQRNTRSVKLSTYKRSLNADSRRTSVSCYVSLHTPIHQQLYSCLFDKSRNVLVNYKLNFCRIQIHSKFFTMEKSKVNSSSSNRQTEYQHYNHGDQDSGTPNTMFCHIRIYYNNYKQYHQCMQLNLK